MSRFSSERLYLSIGSEDRFRMEESLVYTSHIYLRDGMEVGPWYPPHAWKPTQEFYIHKGYESDLLSIPWYVQWRIARLRSGNRAAVVHDYLLEHRDLYGYTRKQADKVFREALIDDGVDGWDLKWMYAGVRLNSIYKEAIS